MSKIVVGGMYTFRVHQNILYNWAIPPIANYTNVHIISIADDRTCLVELNNQHYVLDQKMLLEYYYSIKPLKVGWYVYHNQAPFNILYQVIDNIPSPLTGHIKIKCTAVYQQIGIPNNDVISVNKALLMLPDNEDLMNMFGLANDYSESEEDIKGTLFDNNRLNNIFTDTNFSLKRLDFTYSPEDKKKKQFKKPIKEKSKVESKSTLSEFTKGILYGTAGGISKTTKETSDKKKYSQYCLVVKGRDGQFNSGNRDFFTKVGGKSIYLKDKYSQKHPTKPNLDEAVRNLCTVKINLPEDSIKLFGNKAKKLAMYELSKDTNIDEATGFKIPAKTFEITKFIWGYKCKDGVDDGKGVIRDNTICDVVEVFNGEISLKFKFEDVEIIPLSTKGFKLPKDRTIKKDTICVIKNNKYLNVPKFTRIRVNEVLNNRPSNKPIIHDPYDKRRPSRKDFIVKGQTEDGKQINCRIKHLKAI